MPALTTTKEALALAIWRARPDANLALEAAAKLADAASEIQSLLSFASGSRKVILTEAEDIAYSALIRTLARIAEAD